MRVVIAGGHGKIALLLAKQLSDGGHQPVGLIRNPDQVADLQQAGADPVIVDLESVDDTELSPHLAGADAVVFAAGSGPGSTAARKETMDRDGAIKLGRAAEQAGVRRYVMVSAIATDDYDADSDEVYQIYLRCKSEADAAIRDSRLDWTIVRPGGLTDDAATGQVQVASSTGRGEIPRADVAAVIVQSLLDASTVGKQFEVIAGDTAIADALSTLAE